jgi:hypothetical protein
VKGAFCCSTPDKDAIALLPEFERLGLDRISLVCTGSEAHQAHSQLIACQSLGL